VAASAVSSAAAGSATERRIASDAAGTAAGTSPRGRLAAVEDFFVELTRGNVAEGKVVLAAVVGALACYQVALMAVGWGKLRVPFLSQAAASATHRAVGDTIVFVTLFVALACISYFEFEEGGLHAVAGAALVLALAFKIAVVRWLHPLGRFLPYIGGTVFALFVITVAASAGDFLFDD
jgi:Family of unknown function (DUF6529)